MPPKANPIVEYARSYEVGYWKWVLIFCCLLIPLSVATAGIPYILLALLAVWLAIAGPYCYRTSGSISEFLWAFFCWPLYLADQFAGTCKVKGPYKSLK